MHARAQHAPRCPGGLTAHTGTVRRRAKAGGKQSAKDASGKYARSAGAALRRYNEAALDRDIAELLASWREHLDAASLIFVQAPASNANSIFASSAAAADVAAAAAAAARGVSLAAAGAASAHALISPQDPRVRRIPFVTQRPTFTEARRVVGLLLAVFEPTAAALAAQQAADEAQRAAAEQKAQARLLRRQQKQHKQQQQAGGSPARDGGAQQEEEEPGEEDGDEAGEGARHAPQLQVRACTLCSSTNLPRTETCFFSCKHSSAVGELSPAPAGDAAARGGAAGRRRRGAPAAARGR